MKKTPMKLKPPEGVGDPCVAGVTVASRAGIYEVDADIGALLMECFGFAEVEAIPAVAKPKSRVVPPRAKSLREA
jgi:hypothetical protein